VTNATQKTAKKTKSENGATHTIGVQSVRIATVMKPNKGLTFKSESVILITMRKIKDYREAMLRYYYAPVIGFALVLAVVCGFVIGFDEVWRYWRVVGLNLFS